MQKYLLLLCFILTAFGLQAQCENVNPDCSILSDFECQTNYVGLLAVTNPAPDATNGSSLSGEYNDQNDAYDALIITFGGSLDLSVNNILKLKIYTTAAPTGRLLAILEGGTSPRLELAINAIVDGAWTEYTFDFSSQAAEDHTRLVLILNADVTRTNGAEIYYLDDVRWDDNGSSTDPCAGVITDPLLLNDFECQQNEPFQACFPVVQNPLVNADNGSARVGCFTDVGAEFDNIFVQFDAPLDLSVNNQFRIKVNTLVAGNLLVKLEGGSSSAVEISQPVAGSGTWENLLFDFSAQAGTDHTRLVLFFNAGVIPGADDKYFFDDLLWEAGLPVELASFTAEAIKNDVELNWTTLTESGAADYTVQHATEASDWTSVGILSAAGDSRVEQDYTLIHQQPGTGEHLYRLRMRDLDGTTTYSEILVVTLSEEAEPSLSVYPNPFGEELTASFAVTTAGLARIELNDLLGRTLVSRTEQVLAGITTLRLPELTNVRPGNYFLRVIQGDRTLSVAVLHR